MWTFYHFEFKVIENLFSYILTLNSDLFYFLIGALFDSQFAYLEFLEPLTILNYSNLY